MSEFGVIRPEFTSLNFISFKNGIKIVKKEKIFPIIKKINNEKSHIWNFDDCIDCL